MNNQNLDIATCQKCFNQLTFRYLPNVSVDYIVRFELIQKKTLLQQNILLGLWKYYTNRKNYFLAVHFKDQTEIHFKVLPHKIDSIQEKVNYANTFLSSLDFD